MGLVWQLSALRGRDKVAAVRSLPSVRYREEQGEELISHALCGAARSSDTEGLNEDPRAGRSPGFLHDVPDVFFHRRQRKFECRRNFLIGPTFRQTLNHSPLAFGQLKP